MKLLIFIILILISPLNQAGDFQYVSDQLVITLRTGQGSSYQIIRTLPSGTRLNVITTTDTGYAQVETDDGTEGWIRSQYLSLEPIARLKLQSAEQKLAKLTTENTGLQKKTQDLGKQRHELENKNKNLLSRVKAAESQLTRLGEVAAKPILLDKENRKLQQQNISQEKKLQMMVQENQVLRDRSQREWFITGAIVLLGGILLGLILPKIRWKRRNSWT